MDFKTKEELILKYTQKVGETDAVAKVLTFLDSQKSVRENILNAEKEKQKYAIGDDQELDEERRRLQQAMNS